MLYLLLQHAAGAYSQSICHLGTFDKSSSDATVDSTLSVDDYEREPVLDRGSGPALDPDFETLSLNTVLVGLGESLELGGLVGIAVVTPATDPNLPFHRALYNPVVEFAFFSTLQTTGHGRFIR